MSYEIIAEGNDPIEIDTMEYIRAWCRDVLKNTDWTQVSDSPLSAEDKEKYRVFRQKVRDLPAKYNDDTNIMDVEWPNP